MEPPALPRGDSLQRHQQSMAPIKDKCKTLAAVVSVTGIVVVDLVVDDNAVELSGSSPLVRGVHIELSTTPPTEHEPLIEELSGAERLFTYSRADADRRRDDILSLHPRLYLTILILEDPGGLLYLLSKLACR